MNRNIIRHIVVILLPFAMWGVTPLAASGQASYNQRLYESYVDGRMELWKGILADMNLDYNRQEDPRLLYDLCFTYYGYIGYLISEEEEKAARAMLNEAMKRTDRLEKIYRDRPDVLALQGALLGFRIYLSKFTSLYLGPRSLNYIKTAYEAADTCFNCNVEMGNIKYYTPKVFGGSKEEALFYYEKAVQILETSSLKKDRHWLYMNTVLLLADAYTSTGRKAQACQLYEALLNYEPRADWIRKDLYSECNPR
jgi:tetratricopeptide (TPR) repeat protein